MTGFRVLVVDDEPLALAMVAALLKEDPKSARSPSAAILAWCPS